MKRNRLRRDAVPTIFDLPENVQLSAKVPRNSPMKRSFESEASSHPCNIQKRMLTYNGGMLVHEKSPR